MLQVFLDIYSVTQESRKEYYTYDEVNSKQFCGNIFILYLPSERPTRWDRRLHGDVPRLVLPLNTHISPPGIL